MQRADYYVTSVYLFPMLIHIQVFHTLWHGAESWHTGFRADILSLHLKANSQEPWGPRQDIWNAELRVPTLHSC